MDMVVAAARSDRHEAICDAVFDLLCEVGYDRMSMDAVAARARASKATIYRAWPNKPDLVTEALAYRFGDAPVVPDTGSLRGDLIAHMTGACQVANSPDGSVITGLLTAATRNAELARTLHQLVYEMKHPVYRQRRGSGRDPSRHLGRTTARGPSLHGPDQEAVGGDRSRRRICRTRRR